MEIRTVKIKDIKVNPDYVLSFPLRPQLYASYSRMIPGIPGIVINNQGEILAGLDLLVFQLLALNERDPLHQLENDLYPLEEVNALLSASGDKEFPVLMGELSLTEGLILCYNFKDKWTGLNLYEKLQFIKKISPLIPKSEIYQRTALDINIKSNLMDHLEILLAHDFKKALLQGAITLKTALGLCTFKKDDRIPLLELFVTLPFTSSQQLKMLELCEELSFRDKCDLEGLFVRLAIAPLLDEERPQDQIIELFTRDRYPLYKEQERQWQDYLSRLDLPAHIKVIHTPFFEKKGIELKIQLPDRENLARVLAMLPKSL